EPARHEALGCAPRGHRRLAMGLGGTKLESARPALQTPLRAEDGREFAAEKNTGKKGTARQPGLQKAATKEEDLAAYARFNRWVRHAGMSAHESFRCWRRWLPWEGLRPDAA